MMRAFSVLMLVTACTSGTASAQLIQLKTVPVAAGDQFLLFPSQSLGMGGVSIALPDPLADPFANPALGARLTQSRLYAAPTVYGISQGNGGAKTLPFALLATSGSWFGGGSLALQQMDAGDDFGAVPFARPVVDDIWFPEPERLRDRSARNLYGFGMIGRRLPGSGVSIGASAFLADLNAVDGVDLLYALSESIEQFGHVADFRVGLNADFAGGQALEVLAIHNRFSMTHDVTYFDWIVTDSTTWEGELRRREETNLDRTNTWGVHLGYDAPLVGGWRIGGVLTGNVKSHPKIPNYEIMNIPRDPGTSWAYNIGVGLSRRQGGSTFALDLIYEPIRSHTWAEADTAIATNGGGTILPGEKTVDNQFRFSNARVHLGAAHEFGIAALQLGVQARSYSYRLRQRDLVRGRRRTQREDWMEWTPSWGLSLKLPELEIRYVGRLTTGTGLPGVAWTGRAGAALDQAAAADFIIAPSGPLTLQDVHVLTHQISVSVPLR